MAVSFLFTGYYRHPKFMSANAVSGGELAEVLWCRALDYVNEHGTDGFVPTGLPPMLCPAKTAARIKGLVAAGLWEQVDGGWRMHDYEDWNLTAGERAKTKKETSEVRSRAGKKGAAVRWGGRVHRPADESAGQADTGGTGMADPMAKRMANGWHSDDPGPGPGPGSGSVEREVEVEVVRATLRAVDWIDQTELDAWPVAGAS